MPDFVPGDPFLSLLGPEPDAEYLRLRKRLLFYFSHSGAKDAANSADEVISRALRRVREGVEINPNLSSFCYGIARLVVMEERNKGSRDDVSIEDEAVPIPVART